MNNNLIIVTERVCVFMVLALLIAFLAVSYFGGHGLAAVEEMLFSMFIGCALMSINFVALVRLTRVILASGPQVKLFCLAAMPLKLLLMAVLLFVVLTVLPVAPVFVAIGMLLVVCMPLGFSVRWLIGRQGRLGHA